MHRFALFLLSILLVLPSSQAQTLELFLGRPDSPQPGFGLIRERGRLVRIPAERLPFKVYSNDPKYAELVRHAVGEWNSAGAGQVFLVVGSAREADFTVDWTGKGLPSDCAGMCDLRPTEEGMQVMGLAMDARNPGGLGNMAQVLLHEMGHALGLDHSDDSADIMFELTQSEPCQVSQARLSSRDKRAMQWLYRQTTGYLPIRRAASL